MSRMQASALVRKNGGDVVSAMSKNIDYLVVGSAPGSKYQKAVALGITIINEQEFKELIKDE